MPLLFRERRLSEADYCPPLAVRVDSCGFDDAYLAVKIVIEKERAIVRDSIKADGGAFVREHLDH
ncbi:MAG: hypothetical protein WA771_13970, partial [Chthoniobacterales bacterium]